MAVAAVNLVIEKGTDFEAVFNLEADDSSPLAFHNFTGTAKIKKYPTSPKSQSFDVEIDAVLPKITITMAKEKTLELESGRNYFDIFLTENTTNLVSKVVEGCAIVYDSVSS